MRFRLKRKYYSEGSNKIDLLRPSNRNNYVNFRGRDLYDKMSFSSVGNKKLSSVERGTLNQQALKSVVERGVTINFSATHKEYNSKDYIKFLGSTKTINAEEYYDIVVSIKDGYMLFSDSNLYDVFSNILPKYRNESSTWNFKMIKDEYYSTMYEHTFSVLKPVITLPKNIDEYEFILKAFLEFLIYLKTMEGSIFKILIRVDSGSLTPREKAFSITDEIISWLPTFSTLLFNTVIAPKMFNRINLSWDDKLKVVYSRGLYEKMINYVKQNYGNKLMIANIGDSTCYINLTNKKETAELRNLLMNESVRNQYNIDPKRLRTPLDYMARAVQEDKDLIMFNETDNPVPSVAHEIGHFLIEHEHKFLGAAQRHSHSDSGIFSDDFINFVLSISGFISGMVSGIGKGSIITAGADIASYVIAFLSKTPQLLSEYKASYFGYLLLKNVGATEDDLANIKKDLGTAFKTYLIGAGSRSTFAHNTTKFIGGLLGLGARLQ